MLTNNNTFKKHNKSIIKKKISKLPHNTKHSHKEESTSEQESDSEMNPIDFIDSDTSKLINNN